MSKREQEFYTASEAAEFARCSTQYLDQCRRKGTLVAHGRRNGTGTYMFRRSDLEAWLAGKVSHRAGGEP